MRIKAFSNFSLGKISSKIKKNDVSDNDDGDIEIAEIETNAKGKIKENKKAEETIDETINESDIQIPIDAPPVRPHGPAAELTLEPEDLQEETDFSLDAIGTSDNEPNSDNPETSEEQIKLTDLTEAKAKITATKVEVNIQLKEDAAPPADEEKENDSLSEDSNSLNDLFSQEEEEENPLDSLINSLPDVTVQELMDDLEEIHRIIKEWRQDAKLF